MQSLTYSLEPIRWLKSVRLGVWGVEGGVEVWLGVCRGAVKELGVRLTAPKCAKTANDGI